MQDISEKPISDKLQKLMTITNNISCCLDENEVLKQSLKLQTEIVEAETGSILLLDDTGEYLQFFVALGDDQSVLQDHKIKVGEGIAGSVAKTRSPIMVNDTENDERFNEYFDDQTGFDTQSILCVPIKCDDNLLGVAEVINKKNGPFTDDDLFMLSAFAGQIAVALENARLHEEILSRERLHQQTETARHVQKSYIPDTLPSLNGFEFGAFLKPAQLVSGDFYDYFAITDDKIAFCIGDVSGKGVASAMQMCRVLTKLRTRLKDSRNDIPRILETINKRLCETSTKGMFVTLILFVIDTSNSKTTVFNAGHLPFFEIQSGSVIPHEDDENPPLGISPLSKFSTFNLELANQSQIIAVTDGITEAQNPDKEMFGLENVRDRFVDTKLSPQLAIRKLKKDLFCFTDSQEQNDDMTIISFGNSTPENNFEFQILSQPTYLDLIRDAISEIFTDKNISQEQRNKLKVAVDEAVSNIIEHTYKNKKNEKIDVSLSVDQNQFECVLRDYGEQVDPSKLSGQKSSDDIEPGGLGLHLIDNVFDEVQYKSNIDKGNQLHLRKNLS